MTTTYEWDEARIRQRIEALGLILCLDLNERNHFRVINEAADRVAVIVSTLRGFECITAEPDPKYFAVSTPTSEQQFFTALTEIIGVNA